MFLLGIFTKENIELIKNIAEIIAILIGGGWAFWKFVIQREGKPKIEFTVDFEVIGIHQQEYLAEIIAELQNKGLVREKIYDFTFDLLYLVDTDNLVEGGDEILKQVAFNKRISRQRWFPKIWDYTFADPGIVQRYRYITHLPLNTKFALVRSSFKYTDKSSDFQAAQKTFKVALA
jgi:hypothetical protein